MKISIVIVTFNEELHIRACLESLLNQSCFEQIAEILVVDNGSTDNTEYEVLQSQRHHRGHVIQWMQAPNNHLGASRSLGVQWAQSSLVAFIDGDCLAPAYWLEILLNHWQRLLPSHPQLAGVGGPNRLPESNVVLRSINLMLDSVPGHGFSPQAWRPQDATRVDHLATTNVLFLRSALLAVGNFSLQHESCGEDLEIAQRLKATKYELFLFPEPVVINSCAHNWSTWVQRLFRFGQNHWQLLERQSHLMAMTNVKVLLAWSFWLMVIIFPFHAWLTSLFLIYLFSLINYGAFHALRRDKGDLIPFVIVGYLLTHLSYTAGIVVANLRSMGEQIIISIKSVYKRLSYN